MKRFLRCIRGPHEGATYVLGERTILGRAADCDIQILHDGVSRRHARIVVSDEGLITLTDLSSDNGTFLDGLKVTTAHVQPGATFRIMRSRFQVDVVDDEAHPRPQTSPSFLEKVTSVESLRQTAMHQALVPTNKRRRASQADRSAPDRSVVAELDPTAVPGAMRPQQASNSGGTIIAEAGTIPVPASCSSDSRRPLLSRSGVPIVDVDDDEVTAQYPGPSASQSMAARRQASLEYQVGRARPSSSASLSTSTKAGSLRAEIEFGEGAGPQAGDSGAYMRTRLQEITGQTEAVDEDIDVAPAQVWAPGESGSMVTTAAGSGRRVDAHRPDSHTRTPRRRAPDWGSGLYLVRTNEPDVARGGTQEVPAMVDRVPNTTDPVPASGPGPQTYGSAEESTPECSNAAWPQLTLGELAAPLPVSERYAPRSDLEVLRDVVQYRQLRGAVARGENLGGADASSYAKLEQRLRRRPGASGRAVERAYERFRCQLHARLGRQPTRGDTFATPAEVGIHDVSAGGASVQAPSGLLCVGDAAWLSIELPEPATSGGVVMLQAVVVWVRDPQSMIGLCFTGAPHYVDARPPAARYQA